MTLQNLLITAMLGLSVSMLSLAQAKSPCCAKRKAVAKSAEPSKGTAGYASDRKSCSPVCADWELGVQAWTFKEYTLFEAIDKAAKLGLDYVEVYGGQRLSSEDGDACLDENMPLSLMAKVKLKFEEAGLKPLAMGVISYGDDEAKWRKLFEFCKVMGIVCINIEPEPAVLPLVDRLANEYRINVAIHNHPKPSRYWDPQIVLDALKGRSARMGACADTGHWIRSGLDPAECLKKLEGHILWSHFKDMNRTWSAEVKNVYEDIHDVPWGSGVANSKALLQELHRQGFKGGISIEYEYDWTSSMPQIAKCVAFYRKVCRELAGK